MEKYLVLFQNESLKQLQTSIDYYNDQEHGLGKRFGLTVKKAAKSLEKNPFYQIRYDKIRCLPVNKFPFMLHFQVNEELKRVRIFAILHTSLNPENHWIKNS